ncbi:MAG: Ubiquinone/menaquinone biosynthesis C-methyltransferase UbiE [Verrucomicrobiae bacterium]|nr:Ubiquinone/menaquinone biosynthesis C-methyltransferase UbiE [Verrucomicrobiae bacterium]
MKVRDSGMPDEQLWATFFDAPGILDKLSCDDPRADVVEIGCGYGTFTVAAAARTTGTVYALDLEPAMIAETQRKAEATGARNVQTRLRDFVAEGTGLPDNSVGYAMLFNILHAENPISLLQEAFRVVRSGGKVAVIHWNYDACTPRGPDLSIRPRPEQCRDWLVSAGFELILSHVDLPPFHYGLVGRRPLDKRP